MALFLFNLRAVCKNTDEVKHKNKNAMLSAPRKSLFFIWTDNKIEMNGGTFHTGTRFPKCVVRGTKFGGFRLNNKKKKEKKCGWASQTHKHKHTKNNNQHNITGSKLSKSEKRERESRDSVSKTRNLRQK